MATKQTPAMRLLRFTVLCAIVPKSPFQNHRLVIAAHDSDFDDDTQTNTKLNPYEEGCLYELLPEWKKRRVCNSEDDPSSSVCRPPPLPSLQEIRIFGQNWESSFIQALLLQIILSELVDVPATIESGTEEAYINFYDPQARIEFGAINDIRLALENGVHYGADCTLRKNNTCAHYIPEVWDLQLIYLSDQDWVEEWTFLDKLNPPAGNGLLGQEGWFVPKFTGERDPSLLSYLGLRGQENRRKVAEAFLRPTTWKAYCEEISFDNCTFGDSVAKRPPNEDEYELFFSQDFYTGHFRKTEKNDCDKWPLNCTGHAVDYPCGWTSYTAGQIYHMDIALEFDGPEPLMPNYSYYQMVDLWRAANATKSNLLMMWWTPETLYAQFQGTEAEFTKVGLPQPTQECLDHRIEPHDGCDESFNVRVGDPRGVCEDSAVPLLKFVLQQLYESIYDPSIPDAIRSPGWEVLDKFTLTNVQLGSIFDFWFNSTTPREAICKWAVGNMDFLGSFIPMGYPRNLKQDKQLGLVYSSTLLGAITVLLVLITSYMVYQQRDRSVMKFAQLNFLYILLTGSLLIALGAIFTGMPASSTSCILQIWLINIGYSLELIPLIIKVAAINRLVHAAQRMRRVTLEPHLLLRGVALMVFFIVVFLSLWTALDPPMKEEEYTLEGTSEAGETVVTVTYFCSSQSSTWRYAAVGWNALLLLLATVLAIQARNMPQSFNESQTLTNLIYSHFVFVLLRVVSFLLSEVMIQSTLNHFRSFLFSIDTILTLVIYFLPKFNAKDGESAQRRRSSIADSHRQHFLANAIQIPLQWISNITMVKALEEAGDETNHADHDDVTGFPIARPRHAFNSDPTSVALVHSPGISAEPSKSSSLENPTGTQDFASRVSSERRGSNETHSTSEWTVGSDANVANMRATIEKQKSTIAMLEGEIATLMERLMVSQADRRSDDMSNCLSQS